MDNNRIKIYIAASISALDRAKAIAAELSELGHTVISSWHAGGLLAPTDAGLTQAQREKICRVAINEVLLADALLLLAHKDGRGSLVEAGVAMGAEIPVIALGNRLEITPMLEDARYVNWFGFKEDAIAALGGIEHRGRT